MPTALTPHQIIADITALDRQIADWQVDGRLDWDVDQYLKAQRAEMLETLRERFTTSQEAAFGDWMAFEGDYDLGAPVGYGATEIEAIETLLEMIGEDA